MIRSITSMLLQKRACTHSHVQPKSTSKLLMRTPEYTGPDNPKAKGTVLLVVIHKSGHGDGSFGWLFMRVVTLWLSSRA